MKTSRHTTTGIVLLLIGVAMLALSMGWIPALPLHLFAQAWPLILLFLGLWLVMRGMTARRPEGTTGLLLGMVLIAIGAAKWGAYNHLWNDKVFWPFIFIGLGIGYLLRDIRI